MNDLTACPSCGNSGLSIRELGSYTVRDWSVESSPSERVHCYRCQCGTDFAKHVRDGNPPKRTAEPSFA